MPGISIHVVDISRGIVARGMRVAAGANPFLEQVPFDFGVADPAQHVHLPFKCTPWGYSCFRGGA